VRIASKPARRLAARGAVQASAVFDADNRVFIADMAGWVQAFANARVALWQQQLEGAVSAAPAVDVSAGRVFVGTQTGWVYALATADGSVLWRKRIPTKSDARIVSDLLLLTTQQRVVLSSWGGRFNALEAATGEIGQTWDAGISPQAGASADTSGNCYCLRAVRGEGVAFVRVAPDGAESVLCRQPEGQRGASRMVVAAAPVLDEPRGVAYFTVNRGRDSALHAWSLRDARLLWQRDFPRMIVATPALRPDGALVVAGMDGAVHALAPEGSPLFRYETGAEYLLAGPVCDGAGSTFVGDPLGRLHVIDEGGRGHAVFETPRSLQARPAFGRHGDLHLPGTDRTVCIFQNLAAA
jgi:outer membrane protein assembly factor BamB